MSFRFRGGLVSYSLGIDLGTTFVAAAFAKATTVEMFPLGGRSVVAPAAVYLRGDGTLATGAAASRHAVSSPDRIGREFMSRLGDAMPVVLGGEPHAVTALLGIVLRDVVQKITENEGEPPDRVMLTHPASWGPFRRALFDEGAREAGLKNPSIVTEPEAAAAHYSASRQVDNGETIAVYDLGGRTFDATVLRQQPSGVQILGKPERIERLGGVDFDEAILSYVNDTVSGALTQLDMRHQPSIVALAEVRQDCILAKEALSTDTETTFAVSLPSQRFDVHLARSDFEDMARAPIESTIRALSRTLQSAQVEPTDLNAVLLVGGSSRIPLVARMVSAELGCPTVVDTHPQYVVALGAATLAAHAAIPQYDRSQYDRRQYDRRHASHGTTSPTPTPTATATATATANAVLGARPQQRDAQPLILAQRSADVIPTQRTPPHEATAATARTALGGGAAGPDAATVQASAPVAKPRPALPLPPVDTPLPDDPHGEPDGGRPPPLASTNRALTDRERVLLGTGAAVALAGTIALAIFGATNDTQASTPSGLTRQAKPAQTAGATTGPELAIPTVGATIGVGKTPGFVAISPDGAHAYIAHGDTQVITVVDTAVNQMTATIPIPAGPPRFLTFAPDGRTLYVTIFNNQRTIHAIDVIDAASNTVIATIPQPARPFHPAVTPDGKLLYVPNHDTASLSVVDTTTNTVIAQIKVAPNPHSVAFSRDSTRAYTANHESNLISVIDTATLGIIATIPVGTSPHSIAVHPNRPLVANVNYDASSVSVIDTNTLKVVATIPVGQHPQDIAWAPDGRFGYVVNQASNTVSVIDATTNQVTATIPTGTGPTSITLLPNGRQAYVTNLDSGTLTVLEFAR
jgi:YVTN family beta-propeller protein